MYKALKPDSSEIISAITLRGDKTFQRFLFEIAPNNQIVVNLFVCYTRISYFCRAFIRKDNEYV